MLHLVSSQDSFLAEEFIRQLISDFKQSRTRGVTAQTFEVEELEGVSQALDFLTAHDLFQHPKLAVVKSQKAFGKGISKFTRPLKAVAENPDSMLVLWEKVRRIALDSHITKLGGERHSFPTVRGLALEKWVAGYALAQGIKLDNQALKFLIQAFEGDTRPLSQEIQKLAAFKPKAMITIGDLSETSVGVPEPQFFSLVDALLAGNASQALQYLMEEKNRGVLPILQLASFISLFRTLVIIKAKRSQARPAILATQHPFWLSKLEAASHKLSRESVTAAFQRLTELDWQFKTGQVDPWVSLEEFTLSFAKGVRGGSFGGWQHFS